jgi:two-component system OmpR family response regulator
MSGILFVEDDPLIRDNLSELLRDEGFWVHAFGDAASALAHCDAEPLPDVALLDISLGAERDAGFELCQALRQRTALLPIVFFTSHDHDLDRISGLRLGADDYLTKDESLEYIVARLHALLQRHRAMVRAAQQASGASDCGTVEPVAGEALYRGELAIDLETCSASWKHMRLRLSLTQVWILRALVEHPGQAHTPRVLMRAARITVEPNTIVAHMKHIRDAFRAVDPAFDAIRTERGAGYRWVDG